MTRTMATGKTILVADDQPDVREALRMLLKGEGFQIEAVASPAAVIQALDERGPFVAALIDLNYARDTTSGKEGLDLLTEMQAIDSTLPVIVMTAWSSIDVAVEAMRRGARDFVQKPWENSRLLHVVKTQVELANALRKSNELEQENRFLRENLRGPRLIAESQAMKPVLELLRRVGPSDANILITGEHGTGKEVVAQTLHAMSPRGVKTMVAVNTGAIPEGVFESELFGHVRGAFTDAKMDRVGRFELADGGTIFLDEIANIPLSQQAKLLRVLETGEMERVGTSRTRKVDVRVISATNADLHADAANGKFREDLLFRLNTIEIHLPPLRERREDIPVLAMHFLQQYSTRYRKHITGFDPTTLQLMLDYGWPGNIRELDHSVERGVLMAQDSNIKPSDLGLRSSPRESSQRLEEMSLEEVEAFLIRKALSRYSGNISQAAEALGLSRSALYRRLERYGLN